VAAVAAEVAVEAEEAEKAVAAELEEEVIVVVVAVIVEVAANTLGKEVSTTIVDNVAINDLVQMVKQPSALVVYKILRAEIYRQVYVACSSNESLSPTKRWRSTHREDNYGKRRKSLTS
jgi:hypothetical protein